MLWMTWTAFLTHSYSPNLCFVFWFWVPLALYLLRFEFINRIWLQIFQREFLFQFQNGTSNCISLIFIIISASFSLFLTTSLCDDVSNEVRSLWSYQLQWNFEEIFFSIYKFTLFAACQTQILTEKIFSLLGNENLRWNVRQQLVYSTIKNTKNIFVDASEESATTSLYWT